MRNPITRPVARRRDWWNPIGTAANWGRLSACLAGLLPMLAGCATSHCSAPQFPRPFVFQTDTFAYANELSWEYHFDDHGKWVSHARQPEPDYTQHCFVVARSARQFFEHARFDPALPVADAAAYRRLIHRVLATTPSHAVADADRIVIPGYANLRAFSQAWEPLLKAECGGAWQSYFQHGNWRMVMPITRHHQEKMAAHLLADLGENHPPIVHIYRFPHTAMNHALVLYAATETEKDIQFAVYDPNNPAQPTVLTFDRATRWFSFPATNYFPGGHVKIYEVYRNWLY
jgi:hypothetical protein